MKTARPARLLIAVSSAVVPLAVGSACGSVESTSPPAPALAFTVQPTSVTAGAAISPAVVVAIQDGSGNTVTGATSSITVAIRDNPGGGTLWGTTTVTAVSGVATFGTLTVDKVGTGYTLTASGAGLIGAISAAFNVVPGFAAVSAGYSHTCGVTTGGAAYCWGDNSSGQLGTSVAIGPCPPYTTSVPCSPVPVPVAGALTFAAVSAGYSHACGVTTGGGTYCWGDNGYGELGNGSTSPSGTPVAVSGGLTFAAVSAGWSP